MTMCQFKPVCLVIALISSYTSQEVLGYHETIGIPNAEAIKLYEERAARIAGGSPAELGSFYHQAGLLITLTSGWQSVCSGTLISTTRVLTAAQCWWDGRLQARLFTVVLGSASLFTGGTRVDTSDVLMHSNWNPETMLYDIAMVKMPTVSLSNNIYVIPLPGLSDAAVDFVGQTGTVSGYGKTSDAQSIIPAQATLYHVDVPIISNSVCEQATNEALHGSHICTSGEGGAGPCDGDAGAPLTVVRNGARILVGISSFGLGYGCTVGYPSVYSRVTAFLPWIQANM